MSLRSALMVALSILLVASNLSAQPTQCNCTLPNPQCQGDDCGGAAWQPPGQMDLVVNLLGTECTVKVYYCSRNLTDTPCELPGYWVSLPACYVLSIRLRVVVT